MKKGFTFVADNGPQENSSPLAQLCIACLLRVLKLYKISQISFAEYHSKRNFVERVHAEVNYQNIDHLVVRKFKDLLLA